MSSTNLGHQQQEHDASGRHHLDDQPSAARHPIDQRADHRGHEQERQEADRRNAAPVVRPLRSTSKKNESASATTIAASPPIIGAWVNASRVNFDIGAGDGAGLGRLTDVLYDGLRPQPVAYSRAP